MSEQWFCFHLWLFSKINTFKLWVWIEFSSIICKTIYRNSVLFNIIFIIFIRNINFNTIYYFNKAYTIIQYIMLCKNVKSIRYYLWKATLGKCNNYNSSIHIIVMKSYSATCRFLWKLCRFNIPKYNVNKKGASCMFRQGWKISLNRPR